MSVNVIRELRKRGFVENLTDPALEKLCDTDRLVVYNGFDPTADSLHVGNLLPIMLLKHFQRAGHRPIALVGGATGLIGDPSGKKDERALLSKEQVEHNAAGIREVLGRFLDFEGESAAQIVNNLDWFAEFTFLDFIRDVGKHVRITEMLARDSVKARLESGAGLSFTEFSYQLLQAYDFYHLFQWYGCLVQTGGADQWGNITAGTDLIRRLTGKQAYGLVCPLLTTATGAKFGKTEEGAVWLTTDRTRPLDFYQYWVRSDDRDAIRLLKLFTLLPLEEIAELEKQLKTAPEKREAQNRLAWEVTSLVHGRETAVLAVMETMDRYGLSEPPAGLERVLEEAGQSQVPRNPDFTVERERLEVGYPVVEALVESGLASSKSEARRLIKGGGAYLGDRRIESPFDSITFSHLDRHGQFLLRVGKKKRARGGVSSNE